jgi:hypothetical protein
MPNFSIDLSDDTVNILVAISESLGLPPELSLDERLAFTIDAIANSIDSTHEVDTEAEGQPLQMQEALETILNPHIGSSYTKPTTTGVAGRTQLVWQDIKKLLPDIEEKEQYDNLTRDAICIVFNELPQDEWSSEHAEILIDKTIDLLRHKEAAGGEH